MITETKVRKVEPDITVFEISGRLNLGNTLVTIESAIRKLIDEGARKLVVELSDVSYIDSSGIGMLVSCSGHMGHCSGHLRISGAKGVVEKAFRIVHMDRIAALDGDVETACMNLRAGGAAV